MKLLVWNAEGVFAPHGVPDRLAKSRVRRRTDPVHITVDGGTPSITVYFLKSSLKYSYVKNRSLLPFVITVSYGFFSFFTH